MTSGAASSTPDPDSGWRGRLLRGEIGREPDPSTGPDEVIDVSEDEAEAERRQARLELDRAVAERESADARRIAAETTALNVIRERDEAMARLAELEARVPVEPVPEAPAPVPAPVAPTPAPAPAPAPPGVPARVELRSPASSPVLTVLLGLGTLVAAGIAVYEAYLDRLTTTPGLAAAAATLLLVLIVGRAQGPAGRVWLEDGVLHLEEGDNHSRFDLTSPNTLVEMVGRPGERRWKVVFVRKGSAPYEVTARLVDPEPFVAALKLWRPRLGG